MRPSLGTSGCLAGLGLVAAAGTAAAQPSNGFGWSTINHAGNRAATDEESPRGGRVGSVGYDFRLSRTETTNAQWVSFLQAYLPFYHGDIRFDTGLTGRRIYSGEDHQFRIARGAENVAREVSWRSAARYCNWLHNGMVSEAWAFESGAYDASTFTQNSDGTINDAPVHQSGATFWLPTVDEWAKAAWYDPNRSGAGAEGYWRCMNGSNTPLVSGLPGTGAETSAGVGVPDGYGAFPVGAYGAIGPWSMCDMSGSAPEWTEQCWSGGRYRLQYGSSFQDSLWTIFDSLGRPLLMDEATAGLAGFRLASPVPAPASLWLGAGAAGLFLRKRRNQTRSSVR